MIVNLDSEPWLLKLLLLQKLAFYYSQKLLLSRVKKGAFLRDDGSTPLLKRSSIGRDRAKIDLN